MIDFEITQLDFASAVRQMTKARTSEAEEQVDLTCTRESVRFVVTGRAFSCPAVVQARLDSLCDTFRRLKPELVANWSNQV